MDENSNYSKNLKIRLSRNLGHLAKVKQMVDDGESFEKVMLQMSAIRAALEGTSNAIVLEQIEHELDTALKTGDSERISRFYKEYSKFF